MLPEPQSTPAETPTAWPALSTRERRVLGVLVEKAKTKPDTYPLSLNALVTGCNQKSNREPVLNLSEVEVEDALTDAQKKGLAIKITGGRVERWRHNLYEAWRVDKVELAVLAELLLRGAQTEGELRGRASRMEPIEDLEKLREVLRPLAERGLIVYPTEAGRRGTVVTHGFHTPEEREALRTSSSPSPERAVPAGQREPGEGRAAQPRAVAQLADARAEIEALRALVADLQASVAVLAQEVRAVKEALGM
jgi:uncharacterized protein YceH (UPF0502 family)